MQDPEVPRVAYPTPHCPWGEERWAPGGLQGRATAHRAQRTWKKRLQGEPILTPPLRAIPRSPHSLTCHLLVPARAAQQQRRGSTGVKEGAQTKYQRQKNTLLGPSMRAGFHGAHLI